MCALDTAVHILNYEHKCGRKVSCLKLSLLLYFVQAVSLSKAGFAMFADDMYAEDWGISIDTIEARYGVAKDLDIQSTDEASQSRCSSTELAIIEETLDACALHSDDSLRDTIFDNAPWQKAMYGVRCDGRAKSGWEDLCERYCYGHLA